MRDVRGLTQVGRRRTIWVLSVRREERNKLFVRYWSASYSRRTDFGRRERLAWSAESELANEENASDKKKLEDGIDNIASQQAVKTNAKAVAYAGKHGFIDADGNFVTPPTAENAKAFEDAQTKGWWPEFESKTDSATGVTKMNYVDWGGWLKWLIHGPDHTTTEIECDAAAQTCTLQKCEGGNARIIRCRARKAGEDVRPRKTLQTKLQVSAGKKFP